MMLGWGHRARIERLEAEVANLRSAVADLRGQLGATAEHSREAVKALQSEQMAAVNARMAVMGGPIEQVEELARSLNRQREDMGRIRSSVLALERQLRIATEDAATATRTLFERIGGLPDESDEPRVRS